MPRAPVGGGGVGAGAGGTKVSPSGVGAAARAARFPPRPRRVRDLSIRLPPRSIPPQPPHPATTAAARLALTIWSCQGQLWRNGAVCQLVTSIDVIDNNVVAATPATIG